MNQTIAIFVDAYRELNAKRMFWITLIISGVLILAAAMFGVDPAGVKFLKWRFDQPHPEVFYKAVLVKAVLIDIWLTWGATILALISTAGIFPDFLAGGSIDLYLAKPIGRLRLFMTKYVAGLLFATLQVTVFAVGMFLVVGIRVGEWKPTLLLSIPIVICFYSYLYVICVFLGVLTRSTVTAVLLTLLAWVCFWAVNKTEFDTLRFLHAQNHRVGRFDARVRETDAQIKRLQSQSSFLTALGWRTSSLRTTQAKNQQLRDDAAKAARSLSGVHRFVYGLLTALPKTGPTIDLLDRKLLRDREVDAMTADDDVPEGAPSFGNSDDSVLYDIPAQVAGIRRATRDVRARPLSWVLGTSLGFEAIVLLLAAWVFCRRDY